MKDSRLNGPHTTRETTGPTGPIVEGSEDRPISHILSDILTNIQEIVRSEMRLAKAEITEQTNKAARATVLMAIGGLLGFYALGFVLWSATYGLDQVLPIWLAPLLVGIALAIAAVAFLVVGRNRMKMVNPKPEKTIASVKEDIQWVKDQTK